MKALRKMPRLQVLVDGLCAAALLALVTLALRGNPPLATLPDPDPAPRLSSKKPNKKRRRPLTPRRLARGR